MNNDSSNQGTVPYLPPLDKFLRYGDPRRIKEKLDYLNIGVGPEHIPELIRMATDDALNNALGDSEEVWAPLHAWRALGILRAPSAIQPLLGLFARIDEDGDDWVTDDLPRALGQIGAAAMPALFILMADNSRGFGERQAAAISLKEIASQHPENRDQCVAALTDQLGKTTEKASPTVRSLNGAIISELLDLETVEAAPQMKQAFAAGVVDESVAGDWEDVQIELGLKEKRDTPSRFNNLPGPGRMPQSPFLQSGSFPDLRAINKARKKARSEAKKAKRKRMLQRQRRK
jgi:hypothetical protein